MHAEQLKVLAGRPSPLLTMYLNMTSVDPSRRRFLDLGPNGWLGKQAALITRDLPSKEAKTFQRHLERVQKFLKKHRPSEKALLLISGTKTWEAIPLPFAVKNSLHWGGPALAQMIRLSNAQKPCGVVVLDHKGARLFAYEIGELKLLAEKAFRVDASQWKEKDLGHVTSEGVRKTRGAQRDFFDDRVDAQYKRLCKEIADTESSLATEHGFATIFLVGPDRLIRSVQAKFPANLSERVVMVQEDLGQFSKRDVLLRLQPIIDESTQTRQLAAVNRVLQSNGAAVVNVDETLFQLQNGKIADLLVTADFELELRRCGACGRANRSADPVCGTCGGALEKVTFSELLVPWIAGSGVGIEFVQGAAAERLQSAGGIGGWLRKARTAAR